MAVKAEMDREAVVTQGTVQGLREQAAEDIREKQKVARLTDSIIRHTPPEGIPLGKLRKTTTSGSTRHRFIPALDQALDRGAIQVRDKIAYPGR